MSELTDRLKQIAEIQPGAPEPDWMAQEKCGWGVALSKLCAEALAEIERLQFQVQGMVQVTDIYIYRDTIANHRCAGLTEVTQPAEPTPPWGSTFVMNPENWK